MTTLTEGKHDGEFVGELAMGLGFHADATTVASGETLKAGHIVGSVPSGTSASAAKTGGNTGNGTFVLDATTPILPRAKEGVYTARFTTTTNIRIEDPDGIVIADLPITATNGQTATISEQIKGVFTEGGTTFVVGDGFDITISAISHKVKEYNPAATDGAQIVHGILFGNVDASAADKAGLVVRRGPAIVNVNDLTWKSGLTTAQKNTALATLLRAGIKAA